MITAVVFLRLGKVLPDALNYAVVCLKSMW